MKAFHQKKVSKAAESQPDYYFVDSVSPTISSDQGAHLRAVKQALGGHNLAVLSGGIDARAEANFESYRDKGHFFAAGVTHQNFFAELHGHDRQDDQSLTALPLSGYLDDLQSYEDYARSATVYNDDQARPVYQVLRDEAGKVTSITYFVKGQPVRTDTYDEHHRLLVSEQFGAVANPARISDDNDKPAVQGLMSRTVYREDGKPAFAQTYSPEQLWLLDENVVPTRLFATEAALMAWWLMEHLDGHNHIYIGADDTIFQQLASYSKLRGYLVPIVQDEIDPKQLAGAPFPEILVNGELLKADYSGVADKVTEIPNWRAFRQARAWSVFNRY